MKAMHLLTLSYNGRLKVLIFVGHAKHFEGYAERDEGC